MFIPSRSLSFIAFTSLLSACAKEDAGAGPVGSSSAPKPSATAATAANAGGGCASASFKQDKYGFCLDLPPSYKQSTSDSPGTDASASFRFLGPSEPDEEYGEIDITVEKLVPDEEPGALRSIRLVAAMSDRQKVEDSSIGKNGRFLVQTGKDAAKNDWTFVYSGVVGSAYSIHCAGGGATKTRARAIEQAKRICKSLRTP